MNGKNKKPAAGLLTCCGSLLSRLVLSIDLEAHLFISPTERYFTIFANGIGKFFGYGTCFAGFGIYPQHIICCLVFICSPLVIGLIKNNGPFIAIINSKETIFTGWQFFTLHTYGFTYFKNGGLIGTRAPNLAGIGFYILADSASF